MATAFFTSLRRATRTIDNSADITPLITTLRANSSFNPTLFNMLETASFSLNTSTKRIRVNNAIDINRADTLLRRGELRRFAQEINNPSIPASRAESGFKTSIANTTPDLKVRQMDDAIANGRRGHPDLDVIPNPNQTFEQFKSSLTPAAQRKLTGITTKIKALAGTSLVIAGVVVVVIIGTDLLKQLWDATLNRRGCFQLSTTGRNNNTISCRVVSRTCWEPRTDTCTESQPNFPNRLNPNAFFPTNVPLVLQRAMTDSGLATQIKNAIGENAATFDVALVQKIMTTNSYFRIVADLHLEDQVFIAQPCMNMMTGAFPNTELHLCRACDPSLESTHPGFIDLSQEANTGTSFLCVPSSSLLETIVDIGIGNGVDLLSPFGQISNSGSGAFLLYVLLLVLLIIVAAVVFSVVRKNK